MIEIDDDRRQQAGNQITEDEVAVPGSRAGYVSRRVLPTQKMPREDGAGLHLAGQLMEKTKHVSAAPVAVFPGYAPVVDPASTMRPGPSTDARKNGVSNRHVDGTCPMS